MLRQILADEWVGNGAEAPLCQLPLTVADVERLWPVAFAPMEPQMRFSTHAVVSIDGQVCLLDGVRDAMQGSDLSFVSVMARGDVREPARLIDPVCAAFGVTREELRWISDELAPREWLLRRLDDNGNRVPMWYFKERAFAESVAARYTARGHKQLYYVEAALA